MVAGQPLFEIVAYIVSAFADAKLQSIQAVMAFSTNRAMC